jgi:hypothetical protein
VPEVEKVGSQCHSLQRVRAENLSDFVFFAVSVHMVRPWRQQFRYAPSLAPPFALAAREGGLVRQIRCIPLILKRGLDTHNLANPLQCFRKD